MVVVTSYSAAVVMCCVTMLCWGSWGNTQKLAGKEWKFQLFYWDYTIGILLFSLLLALTMGSFGSGGRGFLADLAQAAPDCILSALIGGAVFNLSNILLVAAIDIAGLAVAFPVGVGLALVIGVVQNYREGECNPYLLAFGVALIVAAIIANSAASALRGKSESSAPVKGVVVSIAAGSLMGLFYSFVAYAISPIENVAGQIALAEGKLTPYTAMVAFALGIFLSNFIFNTAIMRFPIHGERVNPADYFRLGSARLHLIGMLGGSIWCLGTCFNFIASTAAGVSLSWGLGQGATMVSAFWGVFVWKEFKGGGLAVNILIALTFAFFISGLAVLAVSR